MKLVIYLSCFCLLFLSTNLFAQWKSERHLELETRSYSSSQGSLPFWLWANQKGRITEKGKFHQLGLLEFEGSVSDTARKLKFSYGVSLVTEASTGSAIGSSGSSNSSNGSISGQINEAFLALVYKKVRLKIGEQSVETQLEGLSSTNGDFYFSNNSRPYPSIQLSTNGFIRLFKNFAFSAVFEDALIKDQYQVIQNPNFHHQNIYIRWGKSEKLRITAGMDDYAWWGGTSSYWEYGKQPSGFKDYFRVVMGLPGGSDAIWQERENRVGNHLGQYKLTIEKKIADQSFLFYLCHPIEDISGIKWQNYQDNLYGLYWKKGQKGLGNSSSLESSSLESTFMNSSSLGSSSLGSSSLISSAVIEFYFTRNQNVHPTNSMVVPHGQLEVDYFNHGIYETGFTYKGNVIGSPLFYPVVYDNTGKVIGIANTRFYAFHGGIGGSFIPRDQYKLLLTYSVNSGIWNSYPEKLKRFSGLFEYTYTCSRHLGINCGVAADFMTQGVKKWNVLGAYVGLDWKIFD